MPVPIFVPGDFRRLSPPIAPRLILTDPPYNIGQDYGPVSDRLPEADYLGLMEDFANWAFWTAADDAHLFVVHYPDFFFRHGHKIFVESGGWDYQQSIRWCYPSNIGHSRAKFTRSSREALWFTKGAPWFDPKADPEPYRNPTDKRVRGLIEAGSKGRAPYDWWTIDLQKNVGKDHAGYSNQLPRPLLRRIILSATQPGDFVVDPFAGTGSTGKEAGRLERPSWSCDLNPLSPCFKEA